MRLQISRLVLAAAATASLAALLPTAELPASEHAARRGEAMRRMEDGILLVPSRAFVFGNDQLLLHGYPQSPNFFYFTGLSSASGAVLAIDGASRESWLFVPAKLPGIAGQLESALVPPGAESERRLSIDHVVDRKELPAFLNRRQEASPGLLLYTPALDVGHGFPLDIALDDPSGAWNHALGELWPEKQLRSADPVLGEMRLVKSAAEIETLREVGRASALALRAGLAALKAGRPQREAEAAVVSGCIAAGAEGPSFWPWIMTGPNSAFPTPFESLVDYRHLNRAMKAGEVARVDVGCDLDHYKGDVGRTAPVSGRFDAGQRETWELLVAAYRAGLAVIKDGARRDDVFAASLAEVRRRRPGLTTPLGKKAAVLLLGDGGLAFWGIHGVGLEGAEGAPETLRTGMVVAFEPIFSLDGQGFYLEDMLVITATGHEVLSPGLPYSTEEIERAVASRRK
ncbi:MAG: aminopeptidase P N-terminal domain-containing protein [Thermoanaerobaculia bacterium]